MIVSRVVELGDAALGTFGTPYITPVLKALEVVKRPDAFTAVELQSPFVVCMDDRLRERLIRMPGGELTLLFMQHFVTRRAANLKEGREELRRRGLPIGLHTDCAMLGKLGVDFLVDLLGDPFPELELLRRMGISCAAVDNEVMAELQRWVKELPGDFISSSLHEVEFQQEACGEHAPAFALVNRWQARRTFGLSREVFDASQHGVLLIDGWAGAHFAALLTDNAALRRQLVSLYQLVYAGALRRLGSRHLKLLVA